MTNLAKKRGGLSRSNRQSQRFNHSTRRLSKRPALERRPPHFYPMIDCSSDVGGSNVLLNQASYPVRTGGEGGGGEEEGSSFPDSAIKERPSSLLAHGSEGSPGSTAPSSSP